MCSKFRLTNIYKISLLILGIYSFLIQANVLDELKAEIRFLSFQNADQLSTVVINDFTQDQSGYIWIATPDGLNRYDGNSIKVYRSTSNHNLSNSYISSILIDKKGTLWVGTHNGLNVYNAELDNFEQVNKSDEQFNFLNEKKIRKIFEDTKKHIWVSTYQGCVSFVSEDRMSLIEIDCDKNFNESVQIYDFIESNNGQVLLATTQGILKYNSLDNSIERLDIVGKIEDVARNNIKCFYRLNDDLILVGTTKGLFTLNVKDMHYEENYSEQLKDKTIKSIAKISDNQFLIGTPNGIYKLDFSDKSQSHFESSTNKYSLVDNQIKSMFIDRNKTIWIGTNLGINLVDTHQLNFNHIKQKKILKNCLSGNTIYAILLNSENELWVASFGHGLHRIDLNSESCHVITNLTGREKNYSFKNVTSLYEDSYHNIWIGTYDEGLFYFNSKLNKFNSITEIFSDSKLAISKSIRGISSNNKEVVFVATQGSGLYEFNLRNNTFKNYLLSSIEGMDKSANYIEDVEYDDLGNLWLATTYQGLWRFNTRDKTFDRARISQLKKKTFPKKLWSVNLDSEKNLWVGSNGSGAIKYSPLTGETKVFSVENGLLSNDVLNTQQDVGGNIWLYTDKGLSRISATEKNISTFLEIDGLQSDVFTTTGFFDKSTGLLWTGGVNGFNYFNPKNIFSNGLEKKVNITEFELFYNPVKLTNEWLESPLSRTINLTKNILLTYDQNVFAFSFSAIEFLSPEKIKYRYMLEGYDSDWNIVSAKRNYASYTNIDPGNYKFKVKASNKFGEWSDLETSIDITISPPWWETPYAYVAYFILAFSSIFGFIKVRTRVLEQRAKMLEETITQRTYELATEKSKVEQLLSRKNEEFANVSHEFRTPLTLILGPLSQIIKSTKSEKELEKLGVIQRNGYRLLRMVDQLLNMETFRIKSITQRAPQAIGRTITMLTEAFADLANEKEIKLTLTNKLNINFEFTPDALEKILLNLLSNAVKYTRPGGHIMVATERTNNKEFKLSVSDTGIGIPEDKLQSIFERYSRVLDENSEQVAGAGIGLALVKELVEAHQGRIEVESQLGQGTTIIVYLPIIGEVDDEQVKLHSNDEIVAMELMSLTNQSTLQSSQSQVVLLDERLDKPSVLVIEDNADMRAYISNSIQDDYQVLTAKDGEEGVAVAIEQVPDLIISDIMMPKKDGYQATQELRNNSATNHIPIILLTARGDRESRLKGWYEKADEYLTKPFDVEELKIRLKNLLDIREILRKRFAETAFTQLPQLVPVSSDDVDANKENLQFGFIQQLNQELERLYIETSTSIPKIAETLNMSERQFFRKVKSVVDMTPSEYLRRFRLEKAKSLLIEGKNANFSAYEVGFSSQSYFGKCFKAQFGMSPKEFINSLNG